MPRILALQNYHRHEREVLVLHKHAWVASEWVSERKDRQRTQQFLGLSKLPGVPRSPVPRQTQSWPRKVSDNSWARNTRHLQWTQECPCFFRIHPNHCVLVVIIIVIEREVWDMKQLQIDVIIQSISVILTHFSILDQYTCLVARPKYDAVGSAMANCKIPRVAHDLVNMAAVVVTPTK